MIYIKVPKEITEYKTRVVLGLTKKQICFLICGIIAGLLLGLIVTPLFGTNALAFMITIVCVPTVALAFTDKDGIPMDVYIRHIISFYLSKQKLPYGNEMIYQEIKEGGQNDDRKKKAEKRRKARAQKKLLESGITKKEARKTLRAKRTAIH